MARPIILVGGGTGGHIFPLIAIGEELVARKTEFIFVGAKGGREEEIVKTLGWQFQPVTAGKLRRYLTAQSFLINVVDVFKSIRGFFQALSLLIRTGAPVVISKGGYVALPVTLAALVLGRPVYIHESDTIMGLTNRLVARFARKIFTAFAPTVYPKSDQRFIQVGIPIRRALRRAAELKAPQKTRPLILVIGGIQGASTINAKLRAILNELLIRADVVHVTGDREYEQYKKLAESLDKKLQNNYKPFAFLDRELAYYFQAADILISRASATTIAEAALFGKAAILVPLPSAAGNHQVVNAKTLEAVKAAIICEEYQLTPERLLGEIVGLLDQPSQRQAMGEALKRYFHQDETIERILDEVGINGKEK